MAPQSRFGQDFDKRHLSVAPYWGIRPRPSSNLVQAVIFELLVRCWVRTSAGAHVILSYVISVVSSSLATPEGYLKSDHKRFVARGLLGCW